MIETPPMKLAPTSTPEAPEPAAPKPAAASPRLLWLAVLVIVVVGLLVRIWPSAGFVGTGFDEALYRDNIIKLDKAGLAHYPSICLLYIEDQRKPDTITKLPPTRFFYIYLGWLWKRLEFGAAPPLSPKAPGFAHRDPALVSLHRVACLFSCLTFVISGLAAWRMLGLRALPAVLALLASSPLQIHLGQHALIDGVFAFWAVVCLWLLWENLQRPDDPRLLAIFGFSLALMVATKENSFFVYLALCGLMAVNRWAKFGSVTPRLLLVSIAGPGLGVLLLVSLAGGVPQFVEIYRLLVSKAQTLTYAIKTGDGPWYRYLVDLLILSPLIFVLAVGGVFMQVRHHRAFLYLLAFVAFSYLIMCNVRYAMNLRYASIWDLPIRALAAAQVVALAAHFGTRQTLVACLAIASLCAYDLRQYQIFFADFGLYELVTEGLLHAVKILK